MGTAVPHGGTGGSPRLVPTPGRRGEAALWTPSCGLCWVQRGSPSPNTFCVPGTGRHDFRARGAPPTQPLPLPADQASRARPRSAAPWTAPSSRRARARRPGPGGLQRGRRLVRAGGGPALANPAQQGEALQATGRGEEPPARLRSGGGGGGGTRGEITPERCRFRLKMLPAMGVHVECLSWWGMHVDAPGICRALYPHPTGAHICTRPQSHPHSSGLRVELVKTSQPVERAHGRKARRRMASAWGVSEAWLPFIPHPQAWLAGQPAFLLGPGLEQAAQLLPDLVHGPAGLQLHTPASLRIPCSVAQNWK